MCEKYVKKDKQNCERVFRYTVNKFLSIQDHYVKMPDGEFVEAEMMEEAENLFKIDFCTDDLVIYNKEVDKLINKILEEYK